MTPQDYTGEEYKAILRSLSVKKLRNTLKGAYRRAAKNAVTVVRRSLATSGLRVQGNVADWPRGVRSVIYSRGGGFLVTVKARAGRRGSGAGEKGMHKNRFGVKKPILMWAEDGTRMRQTKAGARSRMLKSGGTSWSYHKAARRGRMPAYGFLERATPAAYREVETTLAPAIEAAAHRAIMTAK